MLTQQKMLSTQIDGFKLLTINLFDQLHKLRTLIG